MIKVVLDTNVLVSALLAAESKPAMILGMVLNGAAIICYDSRILLEYKAVLMRPKFSFCEKDVNILLSAIKRIGSSILALPLEAPFSDEADKKFYEVALSAGAYLVTGNGKHFPKNNYVLSPAQFLDHVKSE